MHARKGARSTRVAPASNRLAFTKHALEKVTAPPAGKRAYYYDTKARGLVLDVTPNGVKTFRLYRKVHGKPERITLGRFPDMSIEQARGSAHGMNAAISRGENPTAEIRADLTFGEMWALYLERHAKPHKRSWTGDEWHWNKYLARWAGRRLSTIDRNDVERLHGAIAKNNGKYVANRTLALISTIVNKAIAWGWEGRNPAKGVQKYKEVKRERFLYGDELPAFFKALTAELDTVARDAILVMLFTGARKMNALSMRWQDVNLDRALWTIPQTKSGDSLRVPLVPFAVELLARRKEKANGSEYVFPGQRGAAHRVEVKSAWDRIRNTVRIAQWESANPERAAKLRQQIAREKLPDPEAAARFRALALVEIAKAGTNTFDVRLHDLRRTLGSWQAAAGVSLPIIGKSLGHRDVNTTAIYARLDLDPVRAAVTTATTAMLTAGGLE